MKKIIILILISLSLFGCQKKENVALKFKNEYESLNGEVSNYGKDYRIITIDEENPFIYVTDKELVEKFDNEETFLVYFGFNSCPWCRSVVPTIIETSKKLGIDKIYYLDVKDIRNVLEVDENGKTKTTKEGTKEYYVLLEKMNNVLEDYTLKYNDKILEPNMKRIYAPNIVSVVKGKAISLTSGISDKQTDAYMELSDEIINDSTNKIKSVMEEVLNNNCSLDKAC